MSISWSELMATVDDALGAQEEKESAAGEPPALPDGVAMETFGGYCPVQGEGTVDGHEFYYRARHDHQSVEIAVDAGVTLESLWPLENGSDRVWFYEEEYSNASWITKAAAYEFIIRAVGLWRSGTPRQSDERQTAEAIAWIGNLVASAVPITFDKRDGE